MGDMLSSALEASPPDLKSQLHYIITQLHSDTPPSAVANNDDEAPPSDDSADEDEEEEEETDVIEGDEDEVTMATTDPMGESLLAEYAITSYEVISLHMKLIHKYMLCNFMKQKTDDSSTDIPRTMTSSRKVTSLLFMTSSTIIVMSL